MEFATSNASENVLEKIRVLVPNLQLNLRFKVVLLTPEMARELLAKNHPNNRKTKTYKINQIRGDLESERGRLTYDPIAIDEDGFMVNGQNRCHAVIDANTPLPVLIISGWPRESLLASDQGTPRNVKDIARVSGCSLPYGETQYSAVSRYMLKGLRNPTISVQMLLDFINAHRAALEFAFTCLPRNKKYLTQGPVRAVIARAYYQREYHERTKEFCDALYSGFVNNRQKDAAVITFRNWLSDNFSKSIRSSGKGRPSPLQVYATCERLLKAFLCEENLTKVQETKKELFPIP